MTIARTAALLTLSLLTFGHAAGLAAAAERDSPVRWTSSLQTARQEARRTGKPILIVFGAEWCGYCKKMDRDTFADPATAALINERFVPVHLDLTERKTTPAKKVAKILEVETLPSCVILTADADLLGRMKGYQSPDAMTGRLTAAEKLNSTVRMTGGTALAK